MLYRTRPCCSARVRQAPVPRISKSFVSYLTGLEPILWWPRWLAWQAWLKSSLAGLEQWTLPQNYPNDKFKAFKAHTGKNARVKINVLQVWSGGVDRCSVTWSSGLAALAITGGVTACPQACSELVINLELLAHAFQFSISLFMYLCAISQPKLWYHCNIVDLWNHELPAWYWSYHTLT